MPKVAKLYLNEYELDLLQRILQAVDAHGLVWGAHLGISHNSDEFVALCDKVDREMLYLQPSAPTGKVA